MSKTKDMVGVAIRDESDIVGREKIHFSYENEPRMMLFDYYVSKAAWEAVGHDGIAYVISRHLQCQWGDSLPAEDKKQNELVEFPDIAEALGIELQPQSQSFVSKMANQFDGLYKTIESKNLEYILG